MAEVCMCMCANMHCQRGCAIFIACDIMSDLFMSMQPDMESSLRSTILLTLL